MLKLPHSPLPPVLSEATGVIYKCVQAQGKHHFINIIITVMTKNNCNIIFANNPIFWSYHIEIIYLPPVLNNKVYSILFKANLC